MRLELILCFIGIAFAQPAISQRADRAYPVSRAADTQPALRITQVTGVGDRTIVDLSYTATRDGRKIGVYPPGHNMAFFIIDPVSQKKYALQDVEGIAIRPRFNDLSSGETLRFKLTFDRAPTNRFHLVEGTTVVQGESSWNFINVQVQ